MTSVVDTSVKFFHSDMAGAPVLTAGIGSGLALLETCLVTGFDVKTVTGLSVVGGVARLLYSGTHSAPIGSVIVVSGSSIAALNGEQRVTYRADGETRFATAAADGVASGTMTFKVAPAGWDKPYSATNVAVFRSPNGASQRPYLRVSDGQVQVMRVQGYEAMTDADSGTNPFPSLSQAPLGGYWPKGYQDNANPTAWVIFATDRTFYLHVAAFSNNGGAYYRTAMVGSTKAFGDSAPLRPSDVHNAMLACNTSGSAALNNVDAGTVGQYTVSGTGGIYTPRNYTGIGGSWAGNSLAYVGSSALSGQTTGVTGPFPSPVDGSLMLSKRYLRDLVPAIETLFAPRLDVPGFYTSPQSGVSYSIKHLDVVNGSGPLAGRKLMAVIISTGISVDVISSPAACGVVFFDVTGPWY